MERYCSTGQSPQRAVAPTEEEVLILFTIMLDLFINTYVSLKYKLKKIWKDIYE
jgi:hypothetical protein